MNWPRFGHTAVDLGELVMRLHTMLRRAAETNTTKFCKRAMPTALHGHVSGDLNPGTFPTTGRISIGSLVYSLARRKDLPQSKSTTRHLVEKLESTGGEGGGAGGHSESTSAHPANCHGGKMF